jgi:hypothetical protein
MASRVSMKSNLTPDHCAPSMRAGDHVQDMVSGGKPGAELLTEPSSTRVTAVRVHPPWHAPGSHPHKPTSTGCVLGASVALGPLPPCVYRVFFTLYSRLTIGVRTPKDRGEPWPPG